MATIKDVEDSLKNFIIQEQSDAHNVKSANMAKYNNIKITLVNYKIMQQLIFCLDIIQTVNYGIRAWLNYKNSGIGREVFISI